MVLFCCWMRSLFTKKWNQSPPRWRSPVASVVHDGRPPRSTHKTRQCALGSWLILHVGALRSMTVYAPPLNRLPSLVNIVSVAPPIWFLFLLVVFFLLSVKIFHSPKLPPLLNKWNGGIVLKVTLILLWQQWSCFFGFVALVHSACLLIVSLWELDIHCI